MAIRWFHEHQELLVERKGSYAGQNSAEEDTGNESMSGQGNYGRFEFLHFNCCETIYIGKLK